jgi:hypothetical protein
LGKYLLLPLALLPKTADDGAVRDALARALLRTRTRRTADGERVQSAREIWQELSGAVAASGLSRPALANVEHAVEQALDWERALHAGGPLERAAIERDLGAVQTAIARLIEEVRGG